MAATKRRFAPVLGALYFCDGGAIYCASHLGNTAAYTGRDISGQRIVRVPSDARHADYRCERCGAKGAI